MPHIAHTRYALWAVAGLATLRVAIPLAALAAAGHQLPGLPRYEYDGLTGDATGFYAAAREFMAAWGRLPAAVVVLLAAATIVAGGAFASVWVRRPRERPWVVVGAAVAFAALVCVGVWKMHAPGAGAVGWPLVWGLPMLPYRAVGLPLDQDIAFVFGLVLSLAANAVTVVATAIAGFHATGRRAIGVAAAALVALWPLLTGVLGGERAWENQTWTVDTGLAMYTEPLSTALVAVALALLLSPRFDGLRAALAGAALGLAATVRLTNGLLAVGALALLAAHSGKHRSLPFAAAGAAFVPVIAIYWPKGYSAELEENPDMWPDDPFALRYLDSSWTDSLLFTPTTLLVLVPLALIGAFALRGWPRRLLALWALVNPVVYSFFWNTPQHPRYMLASLPAAFVLWLLGVSAVAGSLRRRTPLRARP